MKKFSVSKKNSTNKMTECTWKIIWKQRREYPGSKEVIIRSMSWFGGGYFMTEPRTLISVKKEWKRETVLEPIVRPLNRTLFDNSHGLFSKIRYPVTRHDACKSDWGRMYRISLRWKIVPPAAPIWTQLWSPLDHKLWSVLEEAACCYLHQNLDSLKKSIVKEAKKIYISNK